MVIISIITTATYDEECVKCELDKNTLLLQFQDKHCSRDALLAGLKQEEQAQTQSPNQNASQYVSHHTH